MDDHRENGNQAILEKEKVAIEPPKGWQIIMFNDDFTTMDFVMTILVALYQKTPEEAYDIMNVIHDSGKAVVAAGLPKDYAITKCDETITYARAKNFPLYCEAVQEPTPAPRKGKPS